MNITSFTGLFIGLASFIIIGLFHPLVIKGEYHFGTKIWPLFLIGGVVCVILSFFTNSILLSSICGVAGFSFFWSILELFEQKKRVAKGWFPKKPG